MVRSGQISRQRRMRSRLFSALAGRFIALRMRGLACWNGTSRYGRILPSAISGMTSSTLRVRVDVVQAHPDARARPGPSHRSYSCVLHRAAAPEAGAVLHVDAVGRGVLRHHQQLLDAGLDQAFGLASAPRRSDGYTRSPRMRRDDAEGAAVVAAFGNLEVGVVVAASA